MITGASEGIGREFALQLSGTGYAVTVVARNEERLGELCDEIGEGSNSIVADLSRPEGVKRIQAELSRERYNLLINNAGFGIYGEFAATPLEEIRRMSALNIDAVVALAHSFLSRAVPGDALINVSSTLAFLPSPSACAYAATKAFVSSFSDALWYEQKKRGIYVMGLCPGLTVSKFHERAGGRQETFPIQMAQTPDQLVRTALSALEKRSRPTVISGFMNRVFAGTARVLSRRGVANMMGRANFG